MVCIRCKMLVKAEIEAQGLHYESVDIGEAVLRDPVSPLQLAMFDVALKKAGLEIMDEGKSQLVERIKMVVIEHIHYSEEPLLVNFSGFLAAKLNYDYTYLSNLFAVAHGMTLEHYIIAHKIEKVKELLVYEGLTLSDIAFRMHYSSVQHLSTQFKKVTGFTPSHFKKVGERRFKERDQL
jgi:AraC-like DNA-binding protein